MILRKPYAFFIKHFRLIHIILALFMYYSFSCTVELLEFFNEYSSSLINVIGQDLSLIVTTMFKTTPIIIIAISALILFILILKKKPVMFYITNIAIYLYVFIIILVSSNILNTMSKVLVGQQTILLVRDLILFAFAFQFIACIIITIRASGFDVKKFDFKRDLKELDISEEDREEVEVEFKFDKNQLVRSIKKAKRYAKYAYEENKLLANIAISASVIMICVGVFILINSREKILNQGTYFNINGLSVSIVDSYLVNTDYRGNLINKDNYYLILKLNVKSLITENYLDEVTTKILIDNYSYTPTVENSDKLFDFGKIYNGEQIGYEYEDKILVYKIPKQLINEKIVFSLIDKTTLGTDNYKSTKVNIEYTNLTGISSTQNQIITKELQFTDSILDGYKINISAFDIQKRYKLSYDFCIKEECIKSYEYIDPMINSNYNKALLKLKGTLEYDISIEGIKNLYDFIAKFGRLSYEINGEKKYQTFSFRKISSKKVNELDTYYIEVPEETVFAESVSLIFTIRDKKYEYILK